MYKKRIFWVQPNNDDEYGMAIVAKSYGKAKSEYLSEIDDADPDAFCNLKVHILNGYNQIARKLPLGAIELELGIALNIYSKNNE